MILGFISFLFLCLTITTMSQEITWSRQGCPSKCGDVTIPFPFGIGSNCSANASFEITCSYSTNPPHPFLKSINRRVLNISVQGIVIVDEPVSPMICSASERRQTLPLSLESTPFTISALYNSFTVLGCTNSARLLDNHGTEFSGCKAICKDNYTSNTNSCNGLNCCKAIIPPKLKKFQYKYQSINPSNGIFCGYALPVETKWFQQEYKNYIGLQMNQSYPYDRDFLSAPLVLEWELEKSEIIDLQMCRDASDYSSSHPLRYYYGSEYVSSTRYCSCGGGEEGNPYLSGGCGDINECALHPCDKGMVCVNFDHGYGCVDAKGHESRISKPKMAFIAVVGALLLLLAVLKVRRGRVVREEGGKEVGIGLEGIQLSQLDEDRRRLLDSSTSN